MGDTPMLNADQVTDLVKGAVADAIKAVNTPDPDARPAASKSTAPAVHKKRGLPSVGRAFKALRGEKEGDAGFELDVIRAAKMLWDPKGDWGFESPNSMFWYKSPAEAAELFEYMGETNAAREVDRIDSAIKAMSESLTVSISGGTAGGLLVPPQFLQAQFAFALAPEVAVRRVPGIRVIPVNSNIVRLPRETTRAGASEAAEAGTLSSADATLAAQQITINKKYAMRRWSSELAADSEPAFAAFLNATVARDLGIQEDINYLRGTGSSNQDTGFLSYSSLTSGPSLGTDGRSPTHDDFLDAVYLLEAANARNVDFVIAHPRTLNSLRKSKDGVGRYQWSPDGRPVAAGSVGAPDYMIAGYLPAYKTTNLSIAQTVGANTDCSTAIVGDSSQVLVLERSGVEIAFSEHLYFTTDELAVRAIMRTGFAILQPAAVSLVSGIRA